MLVGLGILWSYFGTFDIATLNGTKHIEEIHAEYGLSTHALRNDMGRITPDSAGGEVVAVELPEVVGRPRDAGQEAHLLLDAVARRVRDLRRVRGRARRCRCRSGCRTRWPVPRPFRP